MFSAHIRNIAYEGFLACFKLVCESVKIQPVRFRLAQKFRQNVLAKEGGYFPRLLFSLKNSNSKAGVSTLGSFLSCCY